MIRIGMKPINIFANILLLGLVLMIAAAISKSQLLMDISGVVLMIAAATAVVFGAFAIAHLISERIGRGKKS